MDLTAAFEFRRFHRPSGWPPSLLACLLVANPGLARAEVEQRGIDSVQPLI